MSFPYLFRKLFQNDGAGAKLRADIMPKEYLPTEGGTMTGQIKSTVVLASGTKEGAFHQETPSGPVYATSCKQSTSGHAIAVGVGDTGINRGVYASVTNGDDANGNAYPDMFSWLVSREGKDGYTYLTADKTDSSGNVTRGQAYLTPDGTFVATRFGAKNGVDNNFDFADLTDAKNGGWYLDPSSHEGGSWAKILTEGQCKAFVIDTYQTVLANDNRSWYRIWSDGWKEQGGVRYTIPNNSTSRVTFLVPFTDVRYHVLLGGMGVEKGIYNNHLILRYDQRGSTHIDIMNAHITSSAAYSLDCYWYACGY